MGWLLHWLAVHTGSSNTPGTPPNYNFWSGFGSDIGEVTIIGGMIALYRKHTCHEPHCWRLGHHPVEGTPFQACRKHHPALMGRKPKPGHMTVAWHAARRGRSGVVGERKATKEDSGSADEQQRRGEAAAERVRAENAAAEIREAARKAREERS